MPSGMNKQWHEKIGYKAWEWLLEDKKGGASFIQMATWKEAAKRFDDEDDDTETIIEAGFETLIENWRNTISEVLGFEDRNMKFVFSCYNERTGTDGALMKDGQVIKGIMKTHYKSDFKEKDVKAYYVCAPSLDPGSALASALGACSSHPFASLRPFSFSSRSESERDVVQGVGGQNLRYVV